MYLWLSGRFSVFLLYNPRVPQGSSEIFRWAPSPKIPNISFTGEQFSDLNTTKAFKLCLQYSGFEGLLPFLLLGWGFLGGKHCIPCKRFLDLYFTARELSVVLCCSADLWLHGANLMITRQWPLLGCFENRTQRNFEMFWPQKNPNSAPRISEEPWESRIKGFSSLNVSD